MATIDLALELNLAPLRESVGEAMKSVASLLEHAPDRSADIQVAGDDSVNLFCAEFLVRAAAGTGKLDTFEFKPGNRYIELASAIAADRHLDIVWLAHGWPILSLAIPVTSVTEAGGVANVPGGGIA